MGTKICVTLSSCVNGLYDAIMSTLMRFRDLSVNTTVVGGFQIFANKI